MGIDWKGQGVRPTTINWPNQLKTIIDGYEMHRGTVHGVQKDAIQNAWDARTTKKGKDWRFCVRLVEGNGRRLLVMEDYGTHGLTGRILKPEEMLADLPTEERWGRFENVAFRKEATLDFIPLGSRGRGKFVFVGASESRMVYYDTLRADGTYRFGARRIERTESPIVAYDGEEGKELLRSETNGLLDPIDHVGTRVIIDDPIEELAHSVRSGLFRAYVGETWWEIIRKYDADIVIDCDGREERVQIPATFALPERDTGDLRVWLKEFDSVGAGGKNFKIKRLHIVSRKRGEVPENFRGISIQRGGMKVCVIEPRYLPKHISDSIYGYVTLDAEAERKMLEAEGIEHYSYDFRQALPRALKSHVQAEIEEFARSKLGWGADARAIRRQHQRNAERRALAAINRLAKKLGLLAYGPGPQEGGGGGGTPKPLRLSMPDLKFPRRGDRRVNYGEMVRNIRAHVVNDTLGDAAVMVRMFIRHGDRLVDTYVEEELVVPASGRSEEFGPLNEECSAERHSERGIYTIVAKLVSLDKRDRGAKVDERRRSFYVEEDPPSRGIFERCEALDYPDEVKHLMGEARQGETGGYILEYNASHPECEAVEVDEGELAAYLYRLMAQEVCRLDASSQEPKLFDQGDLEVPGNVLRKTLMMMGQFMFEFYSGA
jgi:hypothetical protein